MAVKGWIEIEVRDREGRIISSGRQEMRSFVNNLLRLLYGYMATSGGDGGAPTSTSIVNTAGTSTTIYIKKFDGTGNAGGGCPACSSAPDNDDSYGIVVGSSSTALSLTQYNVQAKISHGSGSGQLDYGSHSFAEALDTGVSPPVYKLRIVRPFTNMSGGSVTIREVGMIVRSYWKTYNGVAQDTKYMIGRDVLTTEYTVPNGGVATVCVTLEVSLG